MAFKVSQRTVQRIVCEGLKNRKKIGRPPSLSKYTVKKGKRGSKTETKRKKEERKEGEGKRKRTENQREGEVKRSEKTKE